MKHMYGTNEGALFLALDNNVVIGSVVVRRIEKEIAELKSLNVRDFYRGYGVGVALLQNELESHVVLVIKNPA